MIIHVVSDWHAQQELQHQRRSWVAAVFFAQNGRSHPNKTISTQPIAKCHSENPFLQVLNNMTNLKSGLSPLIECPCRSYQIMITDLDENWNHFLLSQRPDQEDDGSFLIHPHYWKVFVTIITTVTIAVHTFVIGIITIFMMTIFLIIS